MPGKEHGGTAMADTSINESHANKADMAIPKEKPASSLALIVVWYEVSEIFRRRWRKSRHSLLTPVNIGLQCRLYS